MIYPVFATSSSRAKSPLTTVDLSYNAIGDEGAYAIAEAIKQSKVAVHL